MVRYFVMIPVFAFIFWILGFGFIRWKYMSPKTMITSGNHVVWLPPLTNLTGDWIIPIIDPLAQIDNWVTGTDYVFTYNY